MSSAAQSAWSLFGALAAALLGVAFFFAIIGVFGLDYSIGALLLFIAVALLLFRRPQAARARP